MTNEEKERKEWAEKLAQKYSDLKIVFCDNCFCLNNDTEYGSNCNIPSGPGEYEQEHEPFSNGNWHTFVEEKKCPLVAIILKNGTIVRPEVTNLTVVPRYGR